MRVVVRRRAESSRDAREWKRAPVNAQVRVKFEKSVLSLATTQIRLQQHAVALRPVREPQNVVEV